MNNGVFFDRDGILNSLIYNKFSNEFESPYFIEDLKLDQTITPQLFELQNHFKLFLITNQPSYSKGSASLENLLNIKKKVELFFESQNIFFSEHYYCFHFPGGIIPEYSIDCSCRKPKTGFIQQAEKKYNLNLSESWIIGDSDVDIECGSNAGLKTISILNPLSKHRRKKKLSPDYQFSSTSDAIKLILQIRDAANVY